MCICAVIYKRQVSQTKAPANTRCSRSLDITITLIILTVYRERNWREQRQEVIYSPANEQNKQMYPYMVSSALPMNFLLFVEYRKSTPLFSEVILFQTCNHTDFIFYRSTLRIIFSMWCNGNFDAVFFAFWYFNCKENSMFHQIGGVFY